MKSQNIIRLLCYFVLIIFFLFYVFEIAPLISRRLNLIALKYLYGWPYDYYRQIKPFAGFCFYLLVWRILNKMRAVSVQRQDLLEKTSGSILKHGLSWGLGLSVFLAVIAWFPHYIYWPWWMDLDHFAVSALSWENGILPYRDLTDFNFPGPISFLWIVGKVFGFGHPMIVNAIDGVMVVSLGFLLIYWSRQQFQSVVPGLFSFLLLIRYYFSLDYAKVMQRDWYVVWFAVASVCLIQASKSKWRWLIAALFLALAMNIRPYAVFLVPPLVACILNDSLTSGASFTRQLFKSIGWTLVFTLILWLPLILAGTFDDFWKIFFSTLTEGSYRREDRKPFFEVVFLQFNTKIIFAGFVSLTVGLFVNRRNPDRLAFYFTWMVALVSFLFYAPVCPVRHAYTLIPMEIMAAVACGLGLQLLLSMPVFSNLFRVVFLCFWFQFYFPGLPGYCSFYHSGRALSALVQWQELEFPPPGASRVLVYGKPNPDYYTWQEYQALLKYIRDETKHDTRVVNFLRVHPFPPVNGVTGRLTMWPVGEGVLWLHSVSVDEEPRFAQSLTQPFPAIVVWVAEGEWGAIHKFPLIEATIREHYEPLTKIGRIDIWQKKEKAATGDNEIQ